jgi:hypothetical protein
MGVGDEVGTLRWTRCIVELVKAASHMCPTSMGVAYLEMLHKLSRWALYCRLYCRMYCSLYRILFCRLYCGLYCGMHYCLLHCLCPSQLAVSTCAGFIY